MNDRHFSLSLLGRSLARCISVQSGITDECKILPTTYRMDLQSFIIDYKPQAVC